ncbi:hypothetical protein ACH4TP_32990 [Streptomyces sp. NPDC021012]|uniref:hypothetical protein n=1 Tax=Streptomyces sp. NPDC021012 TaxID=3365107 RepID=UPI0037ABBF08
MSNLVGGLLAVVVLGAGWMLYRLVLYPCRPTDFKYAFGAEYAPHRQALEVARQDVKRVREGHDKDTGDVRTRKKEVTASRDRQVSKLRAEIGRLRREENGEVVGRLGPLRLHEHALVFLTRKGTREEQEASTEVDKSLRLARIKDIHFRPGVQYAYIEMEGSDGIRSSEDFPHDQYDESEVHRFAERIHNRLEPAKDDLARRQERIGECEAQIEQIHASADEELRKIHEDEQVLTKAQREDKELQRAREALGQQRQAWKEMTGFRPWW